MAAYRYYLFFVTKIIFFIAFTGIILMSVIPSSGATCNVAKTDITRLSLYNPWLTMRDGINMSMELNVCSTPTGASRDDCLSARATNRTSNSSVSLAHCDAISDYATGDNGHSITVLSTGDPCPMVENEHYTASFVFKCAKKTERPVFLRQTLCTFHFEWKLPEFCKDVSLPVYEIPCYLYNWTELIDLSPLTLLKGGHLVDLQNNRAYYINICRDIFPDVLTGTHSCPKGSAFCRVINSTGANMGEPHSLLELQPDKFSIKMTYTSPDNVHGCIDQPVTTVIFRCPEKGMSERKPLLMDDFQCAINIEWYTEYACHQHSMTSSTCKLSEAQHGINVDITPLSTKDGKGTPHAINVTSDGSDYTYFFSLCEPLSTQCSLADNPSVCQIKINDNEDAGKSLGRFTDMTLSYSDGEVTLVYRNGDLCHSNLQRYTIIHLQCEADAGTALTPEHLSLVAALFLYINNGIGSPVFREENSCEYIFDWPTRYACVSHPSEMACRVMHDGKLFDISVLTKNEGRVWQGSNWLAVNKLEKVSGYTYYINICHGILRSSAATDDCPAGAAVCRTGGSVSISLGSFTRGVQFDPVLRKVFINYTSSTPSLDSCNRYTVIYFTCKPGDLESGPSLVFRSEDECVYQFDWYTAAACPVSHQTGSGCAVTDMFAGYSFDLNPLTKHDGSSYMVANGDYLFYMNVCAKLTDDHCQIWPHDNAAACQVKSDGTLEYKIGEPSQIVKYYNGVLNITYVNGDTYHDSKSTKRKTEIAFICDHNAGTGQPEFLVERDYTYSFEWRTVLACPATPVECVAMDEDGNQYDLSSLSKHVPNDNWMVSDVVNSSETQKFYINVCQPLLPIHNLKSARCGVNAAVCITLVHLGKESVIVPNLGQALTKPRINSGRKNQRYLSLEYTSGDHCPDGTAGDTYNTTIHFLCVNETQSHSLSPPRKVGFCSYEIIWETHAACQVTDMATIITNKTGQSVFDMDCSVTDDFYTYGVTSLAKVNGFYDVHSSDGSRHFRVNICGAVMPPDCTDISGKPSSVCEVTGSANVGIAWAEAMQLRHTSKDSLAVVYVGQRKSDGHQVVVQINLDCSLNTGDSKPHIFFLHQDDDEYLFQMDTPVACSPPPVNCVLHNAMGQVFDLSPLAKQDGNYDVADLHADGLDFHYLINVCYPVIVPARLASSCPGGPIGGCQIATGGSAFSLGYVQDDPVLEADETIVLRYLNGSVCRHGNGQSYQRSMRISFICSLVEYGPSFMAESNTCEYTFLWKTPYACPVQRRVGLNCTVVDPIYGYQFNLTALRSTNNYVVSGENGGEFLLNVCGPLVRPPALCSNMGACLYGPSVQSGPIGIGEPNSSLVYDSGELSLSYYNGRGNCRGSFNRTTTIRFVCDHSKSVVGDGPEFVATFEDCSYVFTWLTSLACPTVEVHACTVTDPITKDRYDLSGLELSGANYEKQFGNVSYIINICRSLVHKNGQTCPFNSGACRINNTETDSRKKYQSLGTVGRPSIEDGKLIIHFKDGDPCPSGGTMSTHITFSCDRSRFQKHEPTIFSVLNHCEHRFLWPTAAACKVTPASEMGVGQNCSAMNPITKYHFNLSSLKAAVGSSYVVDGPSGHQFFLNICGPVTGSDCEGHNVGSCLTASESAAVNAGNANADLIYWSNGVLTLNYSGGDPCRLTGVARTTVIKFICQKGAGKGLPTYTDSTDGCVYYVNWHTELACEEEVLCEVSAGGQTFDLSSLARSHGNHLATISLPRNASEQTVASGIYFINICRPLNPTSDGTVPCPAGSAVCHVSSDHVEQSLGAVSGPPVYNEARGEVILRYLHGQQCHSKLVTANATSLVIFQCKTGSDEGLPRLVDVTESCQYVFEWETNVVCPANSAEKGMANCSFHDSITGSYYDLSGLFAVNKLSSPQGGHIYLQVCGSLPSDISPECQGSAACLVGSFGSGGNSLHNGSFGTNTSGVFIMDDGILKLIFSGGQDCHNGVSKAKTNILFECDYSSGDGVPVPLVHFSCELNFLWHTSLVCPPLIQDCIFASNGRTIDLKLLSRSVGAWEVVAAIDGSRYWINLCQSIHGKALLLDKCPPRSSVCRISRDGVVDMLGESSSQKMSIEGDGTVVVQYTHGSSACSHEHRRSNGNAARSVIRLTCGHLVGQPVLTSSDADRCEFVFSWSTVAVCKNNSLSQQVVERNHVIHSQFGSIDLRPLLQGGNHKVLDRPYAYLISLEGHLILDHSHGLDAACHTAAVCQVRLNSASYHRSLGTYTSRRYLLNGDQLEVTYTSPEICPASTSRTKNVMTIITFTCSSTDDEPVLMYQTPDCTYIFSWQTSTVCFQTNATSPTAGSGDRDQQNGHRSNISAIIIIFVIIIIVIISTLAIYFHSPERRSATVVKLRNLLLRRKSSEHHMTYSLLSSMEDPDADFDGCSPFEDIPAENSIHSAQDKHNTDEIHHGVKSKGGRLDIVDDSDDDFLL